MGYGPIEQRDFGIICQQTLGISSFYTQVLNVGGFSDFTFAISVEDYASLAEIQMEVEFSNDGTDWYDVIDEGTGQNVVWHKDVTSDKNWVWTTPITERYIRAKFTPIIGGGETFAVRGFCDAVVNADSAKGGGGGGGSTGGGGWIYISDLSVVGGTVTDKVYQDTGNTVLQSATVSSLSIRVHMRASYPLVETNGTTGTLTRDVGGGYYSGYVDTVMAASGVLIAKVFTPNNTDGVSDSLHVTLDAPPELLTFRFIGGYPGSQTELKAGDTYQVTGTTNKNANAIEIQNYGASTTTQLLTFPLGTSFTVTMTIGDRGDVVQALPARAKARNAALAFGSARDTNFGGGTTDGEHLVNLNDLYPTLTYGAKVYPGSQLALKDSETATIVVTTANLDSILFNSPNGDLSITNPTVIESPKTVTRIAGTYNISTNNFRGIATRNANAATTTTQTVISIAHVDVVITVTPPAARLRSGGNNGTTIQNHTITLSGTQQLLSAPTLNEDTGGGTFIGSWSGGPSSWTRTLQVHDDDVKTTYTWQGLVATNLAGKIVNTVTTGSTYVLGGFVARSLTFAAFSPTTTLNVEVITYSKLTAGIFTATNQPALRNTLQGAQAITSVTDNGGQAVINSAGHGLDNGDEVTIVDTTSYNGYFTVANKTADTFEIGQAYVANETGGWYEDLLNTYTVNTIGTNPTTLYWQDVAAVSSNSSGTAQITNVQETV